MPQAERIARYLPISAASGSDAPKRNRPMALIVSEGDIVLSAEFVNDANPVRRVAALAGGGSALAELWGISRQAVDQFERKGYLPLDRAQDAVARWPSLRLRDLVKPEIRDAMDRA